MKRIGARELAEPCPSPTSCPKFTRQMCRHGGMHPTGRWHVTYGGGVVCGCATGESHATREEAELHYYETELAKLTLADFRKCSPAFRCVECTANGVELWTPWAISGNFYGPFVDHVFVCLDEHAPMSDEDVREIMRRHEPFRPGREMWVS